VLYKCIIISIIIIITLMFVSVEQAACAGHCYTESAAVLDTESQRALETVQRAADNIIKQKDQIIEW